jgi:predicted N-acetyltransferase YhbS
MAAIHLPSLLHATSCQLEQAVACNHTELFCQNAIARGGEIRHIEGLICTYDGAARQAMVGFPVLDEGMADRQLDGMMAWYGRRPNQGIGCWSLDPPRPVDLGVRLLSRGFQDGWRPCWMALDMDLGQLETHGDGPEGLQIIADNHFSLDGKKDLPYTGREAAVSPELLERQPEQAQQFIALLQGAVVGHCSTFFTTGAQGVMGLYDVAVTTPARGLGIGKALVLAACLAGKDKGYRYAVLNATGRRIYEQIGFHWVGDGFTWWLLPA